MNNTMEPKVRNHNSVYVKIVTFFLLLTVAAIFVILHFALSKATIKIYSNIENLEKKVLVEMRSENDPNVSADAILGKIVKTEFELSATASSSYEVVPSDKAGGYVVIYNNYSKDQPLVKTTRLLTPDNKLYRIQEDVNVLAGESVEVWAEADQTGEEFTIDAVEKMTIPGLWEGLQDTIYAAAPNGMKPQGIPTYVVTDEDIKILDQQMEEVAKEKVLEELNDSLSNNLQLSENKLFIDFSNIETTPIGTNSEEVFSKKNIEAKALLFSDDDLKFKAQEKFIKELGGEQSLVEFNEDSFEYEVVEFDLEDSQAILEVNLMATVNTKAENLDIQKEDLAGLDEQGVKDYLRKLNVDKVEVEFFPFWIKTVPNIKDHIIIE